MNDYRTIVRCLMEEYASLYSADKDPNVDTDLICDDEHGEYVLMRIGWHGEKRIQRTVLYVRLRNNKIYIEDDWTEDSIARDLVREGVPNQDIVLAFNPPRVRHLTEFAVA